MKSKTKRFLQRCQFFGIGSALVLALWLATAIASPAQTFNVLTSFDGTDGTFPVASLIQGTDGNLYGTTDEGGANSHSGCGPYGCGTVFKITARGVLTGLYSFCSQANCADGASPSGLIQATDGNFYGTTVAGGNVNSGCYYGAYGVGCGTVFKITPAGELTTLYSFCSEAPCTDGSWPSGLVQATDGNFYGTTIYGGLCDYGCGTVFRVTADGVLTTLYTFCSRAKCIDGDLPVAGMIQTTDGNFYGTTQQGGSDAASGTVFKITPQGKLTTIHSFHGGDGWNPSAGLMQAADGNFYGSTNQGGGKPGYGTVFKIAPNGKLTTLHRFDDADGNEPGGLVQATDGNFYGGTAYGGANSAGCLGVGCGTVFKITSAGILTTLYSFCAKTNCADGARPLAGMIQATDGNFYGTTQLGGGLTCNYSGGCGTVFSLSMGLAPLVTFVQPSGKVGWKAEILGQGFTGTSGVSFNGTPATFTVKRDTYLIATVPAGATTGPVTVTTPNGTLTSNVWFRVRPTILSFSPTSGTVGTQVTITGVSLTQTETVNFAGVNASFTVNSDTQVTATVPNGAQTGKIAIVTLGGKTWSKQDFTVTQ